MCQQRISKKPNRRGPEFQLPSPPTKVEACSNLRVNVRREREGAPCTKLAAKSLCAMRLLLKPSRKTDVMLNVLWNLKAKDTAVKARKRHWRESVLQRTCSFQKTQIPSKVCTLHTKRGIFLTRMTQSA